MRNIGFSTGAVAYADFQRALDLLSPLEDNIVELSALRWDEVQPMLEALPALDLRKYKYVSLHAPSKFSPEQEPVLIELLTRLVPKEWTIILHPDSVTNWRLWRSFGSQVAIENMDRRKPGGRSVEELQSVFSQLPEAGFCFDIGHARQCDSSMTEAYRLLVAFGDRLRQVHISEVNEVSHHDPISFTAMIAFQQVSSLIPVDTPIIIESRVSELELRSEMQRVEDALAHRAFAPAAAS